MGLDTNGTRFLLEAHRGGVSFQKTATLGRQALHLSPRQMQKVFSRESIDLPPATMHRFFNGRQDGCSYADSFFEFLGAEQFVSIDASDYEGATYKHNLNNELPDDLRRKFTCVVDGGTLEHIFDLPNAFLACMQMLTVGGHFLSITPCNNFMGHGFYQLSPELIWGVFSKRNGFEVEKLYIFEDRSFAVWYEVSDPRILRTRVPLCNKKPTYLLCRIKKTEDKRLTRDSIAPTQSDYEFLWGGSQPRESSFLKTIWGNLRSELPQVAVDLIEDFSRKTTRRPQNGFSMPFYRKYR